MERISYLGPKIWDIVPDEIKQKPLSSFEESITKWIHYNCPCRLCKTYLNRTGFTETY